jgi:putative acetyltransferase
MKTELVQLRTFYAAPGFALLAHDEGPAGCVAFRSLGGNDGEIRRLFVSPNQRTAGLGRRLVTRLIEQAKADGFQRLFLNTLPTMTHAIALYESLGFIPTDCYVGDPTEGILYFSLVL